MKVTLAAVFLVVFLIVSLVLLSHLRQRLSPFSVPFEPPEAVSLPIEDVRVELESLLLRSGASLDRLETSAEGETLHWAVRGPFPPQQVLQQFARRLERISPDIALESMAAEGTLRVLFRGRACALLIFSPTQREPETKPPRVAIIMDDLGRDLKTARALLDIDLPVTLAILPTSAKAAQVAALGHRHGREIFIHIPMEPQSYPATDPGRGALFVNLGPKEIRRRMKSQLQKIPHAVGGNNHMGSRFTESREGMAVVMEVMREAGLFFVDSRTTGGSVVFSEARRAGVPALVRDRFLDNRQDVNAIAEQIRSLARLARSRGSAVGICHPYPQTLEALRREAGIFRELGVEVVSVAQLLEDVSARTP
ncbi:divergent polysaccharide deacetylase family protein [uncultured Desulfuromonas sp.]|uniref:divergent polysaccharide deacetylase family protein n=1 Tax=uncultured Desulfuromonas sp. TaxID=181013 RepID=UPI00263178C3|nr:divergent polysaccharide deacetylase family protein [uncultured Desulfuromonas sp.]